MADDASITTPIQEHPAVQAARLRAKCEKAVDRLLAILDALGPDPDLEPSLGGLNAGLYGDQRDWAAGLGDDLEEEHDGREPWLGSLDGAQHNVLRRDASGRAIKVSLSDPLDQSRWADSSSADVEEQCEDEGAQCDDEGHDSDREPDQYHFVPNYAGGHHDQTKPLPY